MSIEEYKNFRLKIKKSKQDNLYFISIFLAKHWIKTFFLSKKYLNKITFMIFHGSKVKIFDT